VTKPGAEHEKRRRSGIAPGASGLPIFDACYGDGGVVNEAGVVRHSSLDSLLDLGLFTYTRQKKLSPAKIADMDINNF
jgi:hypothetical protein